MPEYRVTPRNPYSDAPVPYETVVADFCQHQDRWITFKNTGGKMVAEYPESEVQSIKVSDPELPNTTIQLGITVTGAIKEAVASGAVSRDWLMPYMGNA